MDGDPFQRKYYALKRKCDQVQQTNEKLVNRIQHVKKMIKKYKKERRFLMTKLDENGDEYREIEVPAMYEESHPNAPKPEPSDDSTPLVVPMGTVMAGPPDLSFLQQMVSPSSSVSSGPAAKKGGKGKSSGDKKPANAFFMFCQHKRQSVLEQHQKEHQKDLTQQEVTRKLSQEWNSYTAEQKKVYHDMYEKEMEKYESVKRQNKMLLQEQS